MKFIINRIELERAMSSLLLTTGRMQPILSFVKIDARDVAVTLYTTNLESSTVVTCHSVQVEASGSAMVPADLLAKAVARVTDDTVHIELCSDGLAVVSSNARIVLQVAARTDDLPPPPAGETGRECTIKPPVLLRAIRRTSFMVSDAAGRMAYNGLAIIPGREAKICGARSSGMMIESLGVELAGTIPTIIPKSSEKAITALLASADENGEAKLTFAENALTIECDDVRYRTNLMEGTYPEVEKFIPEAGSISGSVSAADLYQAVQTATLFSQENGAVEINIDNKTIDVSASEKSRGQGSARTYGNITGSVRIGVNPAYLGSYLKSADTDDVKVSILDDKRPAVFRDGTRVGVICLINLA